MKRKGLTIRKKIIAIIMFISVLIISIGFIFEISKDVRWLKRDLLNNARLNTRLIGEYTVSPLFFHDKEGAKEVISKLQAIPNFMSVKLYNHDKELFASFSTSLDTFIVETIKTSPSYEFHRNYLVVQEPVYYDGNLYGIIVTKISTAPMYAEIKSLLFIILGILAALLLLAYILASHFQKIISTPILKLASVTQEITDKADYSIRLQHPVKDEIGQLYDGFNNMLSQLQKREIERDKAEKNLKEAKERAEQADKLKTAFLSNMSHEIRTPMNSIIGFSSLMAEEDLTPGKKKEYAELITNSGNSLLNLVDDIIDIAKIEAEQIRINKTECNISIIMNEIYVSYNEKMNLGRKNDVELIFNRNNFHDNLTIKTDPYRFRQVLSNLLSNAIKFTDKGFVEFGIEDINQDKITFFVRDTGIGLSDDKKNLVFDRFRKIEDNKTKLYRGAGLGLTICKKLINLLGGDIFIDSEEGKGSVFRFTIPNEQVETTFYEPVIQTTIDKELNWSEKTILVAEDEEYNFLLINEVVKKTGVKIVWAKDGLEAVELFGKQHVDLVLMDIKMPNMDGFEATVKIKEMNSKVPVIAQTAFAMTDEKEKSFEAGCDGYLAKPIKPRELLITISQFF